ncbi:hypothetical protein [Mycoplasmopsis gallinarum]|uniref:Uncharacterized protein n=1 Tax=Mycoplasmopsis gallinarum TaxID=29557 RepID=A0A162QHW9_9BACT|nr:hypothetical protein [Mycoplasmopsis gallinarum]OAB48710.1 hypothetical protein MGALLINA_05560 [Mycoplasmopsis gallinarum]
MAVEVLNKLNSEQEKAIYGGGVILSTIVALTPLILSGITVISNVIKMFSSKTGELKTKENTMKWDDSKGSTREPKIIYMAY